MLFFCEREFRRKTVGDLSYFLPSLGPSTTKNLEEMNRIKAKQNTIQVQPRKQPKNENWRVPWFLWTFNRQPFWHIGDSFDHFLWSSVLFLDWRTIGKYNQEMRASLEKCFPILLVQFDFPEMSCGSPMPRPAWAFRNNRLKNGP
jgi:hypothetical protein